MAPPIESIGISDTGGAATASASDQYAQLLAEAAAKKNAPNSAPSPTPAPVPPSSTQANDAATVSPVAATDATTDSPALNLTTYKNADGDTVNIATGRVVIAAHGDGHRGLPDPTAKPVGANGESDLKPSSTGVATVGTVSSGKSGSAPHPGNDHADTASDNLAGLTPQQQKLRQVYSQT